MSSPISSDADVRSPSRKVSDDPTGQIDVGPRREANGGTAAEVLAAQSGGVRVSAAEKWLARRMFQALGSPPVRMVLPGGEEIPASGPPPVARVLIRDRATLRRLLFHPNLSFGDAYAAGAIEVEGDLLEFLEAVYRSKSATSRPAGPLRRTLSRWRNRTRSNTLRASRANIHYHYDIGNDFYKLWLDDQLVYTCAYFPTPQATLEQAQVAKMDLVCRKLWLRPGETVVEAGCGWGALGLHMAKYYGVNVRAFNISHEQIAYARQQAQQEGLSSQAEFIEDDYRAISGRFDVFVSVGMLEHVGADHYRKLGRVIDGCLGPGGRGMIHSIGQNAPGELSPWIRRRIFPGAYPPTLREMSRVLEPWGFSVLDVENLRLHYAETLRHWLRRFESAADQVAEMFDRRFVRMWRLYLAGSVAAFASGELQLFQLVFARPKVNEIPWTRARLYDGSEVPAA
jgi:cyclopropane-fatty-acyl-phospholipid synthase